MTIPFMLIILFYYTDCIHITCITFIIYIKADIYAYEYKNINIYICFFFIILPVFIEIQLKLKSSQIVSFKDRLVSSTSYIEHNYEHDFGQLVKS